MKSEYQLAAIEDEMIPSVPIQTSGIFHPAS
jgi:hypothetical protein